MMPQTTFHKINPWTREKIMTNQPIDPNTFEVCDDKMPGGRQSLGGKYDARFKALKVGQAFKVPSDQVNQVSTALRKYIQVNKLQCVARSTKYYPGADVEMRGRVWLMPAPKPALKRA